MCPVLESYGLPVCRLINSVCFHPTKNVLISASNDGKCKVWTLPEVVEAAVDEDRESTTRRLSDQGAYALSCTSHLEFLHETTISKIAKVDCLAFSTCGNFIVSGADDGVGRVWDIRPIWDGLPEGSVEDEPYRKLVGHTAAISNVHYSKRGDKIATSSIKVKNTFVQ